ncbi:cell wall-binding repeat-containing protein [Microbacterium sp. NPDC019599]|uniref:cell wall-binding repeat-containing protein n=1 Tax=Microbacterium sp. NPDC019599 TaxID=3154690 RepID=UPI0033FC0292
MRRSVRLARSFAVGFIAFVLISAGGPASAIGGGSPIAATAAAAAPATSPSGPVQRVPGADRYAGSAAISASTFAPGVSVAYVATGENFPNALSAGAAGGAVGAPVLLTAPGTLPAPIRSELARLKPAKIYLLGDVRSVSDTVKAQLASYTSGSVQRLAGSNRYGTSAAISASAFAPGVPVAYVATGENFPNAMSGGAAAGARGGPLLLTAPGSLPAAIRSELTRLKPKKIILLGDARSVSDGVATELDAYTTGPVQRLSGRDRYGTSAAASADAFAAGVPIAYVASGENFAGGLSAPAAAGHQGGPVLLTAPDALPTAIRAELARLKPKKVVLLGGAGSVSDAVRIQLAAYATAAGANPQADGWFTFATYPDTQQEVFPFAGTRFIDRSKWLVAHRGVLDLRFVAHTGDVVNWDTDTHDQYVIARAATVPLDQAGIPYQLSIGNHDSYATGEGGSAREPLSSTYAYQRITTTFNQYWHPADYLALAGQFEAGKVDNTYSVFQAEGTQWLVLNLELWPRGPVVDWAAKVIATHPQHNVIIHTHSFLDRDAQIAGAGRAQTKWEYGDSSPQLMYDRLVAPYGNVKVVTSGHVGTAMSRVITTASGNRVAFMVQAIHSNTNNPVRLSQFDVAAGTITTQVYAPQDNVTWDVRVLSGLTFIRG